MSEINDNNNQDDTQIPESTDTVTAPAPDIEVVTTNYAGCKYSILFRILTWICRITLGGTFIFSGIVKAIDPWGTFYKFQEYFAAMDMSILPNLILTSVFALCATEFLIGIFILLGCYRKSAPVLAILFMAVMLPLTLWVAVKDPVKDCGCFGDFLIISNWATFWKNVLLTSMAIWLLKFNRKETAIITPALQWLCFVITVGFIGAISFFGYFKQPLLDFRPYGAGQPLISDADSDDENYSFVYEKDGVRKTYSIDDELPSEEDGWVFVERRLNSDDKEKESENPDQEKTFRIWDVSGEDDVTESVLGDSVRQILLLIPDLQDVSPSMTWKINALYDWTSESDITMDAVVSGTSEQIDNWKDLSMPQYDIYTADDTAIKEIARGNPSVVYLENNRVVWKSTLNSLNVEEMTKLKPGTSLSRFAVDGESMLKNWTYIYLCVIAVLIMFSMLPRIRNAYKKPQK